MGDEARQTVDGLLQSYPWIAYWWVLILAGWGGVVNYIRKVNAGEISRFSLTELVGELVTSGFAGLLTFLICRSSGIDEMMTAVLVGISGHMGARGISAAEHLLENWATRRFDNANHRRDDE